MIVVGTVISNICFVEYLRTEKKRKTIKREACDQNFNAILRPEMWNKESLQQRKEKLGTPYFNQEFRNIPLSKEDTLIKLAYIQEYTPEETPVTWDMIVGSIDPIRKASEKSDYMGISYRGVSGRKKYCLFSKAIRLSRLKAGTFIIMVQKKYHADKILYESNVEGTLYERLEDHGMPMEEVVATKDKYAYLLDVQPQFERGEVYLRKEKDETLKRQLTNFPDVDHDDVMDTCTKALKRIDQNTGGLATSI
jgi:predicted phage terminase large subunit-like protein